MSVTELLDNGICTKTRTAPDVPPMPALLEVSPVDRAPTFIRGYDLSNAEDWLAIQREVRAAIGSGHLVVIRKR